MPDPLAGIVAALDTTRLVWARASVTGDDLAGADADPWLTDASMLSPSGLIAVNDALGGLRRHLDAVHARVAAEIARQSRPELGNEGLARRQGYRSPATLIAATTGTTAGDASRLVAVGDATAPRATISGESIPARHPHIADALATGTIGAPAAAAIISMLDRVALRAAPGALDGAERVLTAQAAGLSLDQLVAVVKRAEAHLDPDGVAPREEELRADRALHMREERSGMLVLTLRVDPEGAAPVKVAIEALATAELRRRADAEKSGALDDRRTVPQLQADALVDICRHALGCSATLLPLAVTTVVVRIGLDQLESGIGSATIDGIAQPVSPATVRRMAADAKIIPCVLGGSSEILDWGRARRLFTPAQRLAMVERDGGCAFCGLPPGFTEAHHLKWWVRDHGPTDVTNGVLLCTRCHHRIHSDDWEIRVEGAGTASRVWFIPPRHVDPSRTPRLGGRARFDYVAA